MAVLVCATALGCATTGRSGVSPTPPDVSAPGSTSAPDPAGADGLSPRMGDAEAATPPRQTWRVGERVLPRRKDGFGQVLPTPPELVARALPTADVLPPPSGERYAATVTPVPGDVLARSTWRPDCPVRVAELRYLTMPFHGFDGRRHTGEMIVHATVADEVTRVFGRLHDAAFPIEEMRVVTAGELDAPPTGDGNNTTAFVCRPARNLSRWSAHAYGLAVDVNPFCNPYVTGDLVLPELASAYLDRQALRPGMIRHGDVAQRAFAAVGWTWGGTWRDPKDIMHFSQTGE